MWLWRTPYLWFRAPGEPKYRIKWHWAHLRPEKDQPFSSCSVFKYCVTQRASSNSAAEASGMAVLWDRLVRYRSADGSEKYGIPLLDDTNQADSAKLAANGKLTVKVCTGKTALDASPTETTEIVEKLLGPLSVTEVPIIRCIGLNYKTHSRFECQSP